MSLLYSHIKIRKLTTGIVYNVDNILSVSLCGDSHIAHGQYMGQSIKISGEQYLFIFNSLVPLYNIKQNLSSHYEVDLYFRSRNGQTYKWKNKYTGATGCVQLDYDRGDKASPMEHQLFDHLITQLLLYFDCCDKYKLIIKK